MLASLLAGERLRLTSGPGAHALVADAEIALVGSVAPRERLPEGPFGDHYGYYSLRHDYPVFRVSRISAGAGTRSIRPPSWASRGRRTSSSATSCRSFSRPSSPSSCPASWTSGPTGRRATTRWPRRWSSSGTTREAMASAFRILGEGQLALTKFLLVTDRGVDLRDFRQTLEHVLARTNPETDLYVFSNLSMDTLDYTGPAVNEGSKGVWLGLGDPVRELPRAFRPKRRPPPASRR